MLDFTTNYPFNNAMMTLLYSLISYCIGSISSAVLVSRGLQLPDPRTAGSQNPGTTNVLRLGGKKAAVLTLLGDALKGFLPVFAAGYFDLHETVIGFVSIAVVLGHLYPVFFKFKGGKGVATALGVAFGLSGSIGFLFLMTWGAVVAMFRISSLGALMTAFLAPFYVFLLKDTTLALFMLAISGLIFWRHQSNIKRLMTGVEPKMH
jgi:glycerol-3-phosphate acyltransferase PlsY